ncbi:hypothetical protein ACA910_003093 [Epithemia clementina (nom. ined.)]
MSNLDRPHPASRYRAGNGALFTSSKCPPATSGHNHQDPGGLTSSCELPFGFLYTPMAVVDSENETTTSGSSSSASRNYSQPHQVLCTSGHNERGLPPILCLTCLAYLNLYASIDNHTPGIWYCALCGSKNAAPAEALRLDAASNHHTTNPALISPLVEYRQPLLPAAANEDNNNNSNQAPTLLPPPAVNLILVLDGNLSKEEAHEIPRALQKALVTSAESSSTTPKWYLGLIVFEQQVSVYQLGISGMACADVFTTEDGLNEEHFKTRDYLTPHNQNNESSLDRLTMCISAAFGVVESNHNKENNQQPQQNSTDSSSFSNLTMDNIPTTKPLSRLEILKQRKAERLKKQQQQQQQEASSETPDSHNNNNNNNHPPATSHGHSSSSSRLSPWMMARRRKQENRATHQRYSYRATGDALHTALNLCHASFAPIPGDERPTLTTSRILLFTNGCPNHGDGSVVERPSGGDDYDRRGPDTVDPLKLARSIEFFDILARSEPTVAIDVFCTGSSELGIAAYQALVEPSGGYVLPHESFVVVPAPPTSSSSSSEENDVSPSMPQQLQRNLAFLLQHTYVSNVHPATFSDLPHSNSNNNNHRRFVAGGNVENLQYGCVVDIRASPFLTPTHLVGPGELVNNNTSKDSKSRGGGSSLVLPNERSAFALGSSLAAQQHGIATHHLPSQEFVNSTLTRLAVGRVDPLSTYSIMFRTNDSFAQKIPETSSGYAFFQCVARFVDPTGNFLLTRVATHRLAIAKDVGEFLDSVDDDVIPVVLGKEAVYRSMFGREMHEQDTVDAPSALQLESLAFRAQEDLDATVARISGAYRLLGLEQGSRSLDLTEGGGVRAAGSSFDFAFPPELSVALRRLYYLRRGPLLNPGPMRSLDDRAEIRSLFIRFPMEDCLCMMAPLLWRCGPDDASAGLDEILPETLALWSNSVIAADNYHTIFIWSGRQVSDSNHDNLREACKTFLMNRSEFRFPMPQLHIVKENDSMSRRFTTLLAPTHGDPIEHSLTTFPALARLSAQELEAVRAKFKFYDPESDPSFRSWFWSVVSATSKSKDRGISLCE